MNNPTSQPTIPSQPRSITLPSLSEKYAELLSGPPESVSMQSGFVELLPGESVGSHSTGDREEMVVTISGKGEVTSPGMDPLPMHPGCVVYNPPQTVHNVVNSGDCPLRYIYIVARA